MSVLSSITHALQVLSKIMFLCQSKTNHFSIAIHIFIPLRCHRRDLPSSNLLTRCVSGRHLRHVVSDPAKATQPSQPQRIVRSCHTTHTRGRTRTSLKR
jgi:hypothetical protein